MRTLCTLLAEANMPHLFRNNPETRRSHWKRVWRSWNNSSWSYAFSRREKSHREKSHKSRILAQPHFLRINYCFRNSDDAALSNHLNPSTNIPWGINRADHWRRRHIFRMPRIHGETTVCWRLGHSKINIDSDCIGRTPDQEKRRLKIAQWWPRIFPLPYRSKKG